MLPLHPQMGGEWDEPRADYGGWVEKSAFRGAVCLEGDRENQRQGSLDNFIKKFRLRGPEAW